AVAVSDPLAAACSRRYTATYHGPRRTLQDIRLIVLHSTEGRTAESAARYFASPERTGSAHFVIDADYCFRTLAPTWVAWAAPGANHDGLHIEQAGFAHWTREQWLAAGVVERVSYRVAVWARLLGVPLRWLTDAQLRAGSARGLTTHAQVTRVFPGPHRDHWAPGPSYPRGLLLRRLRCWSGRLRERYGWRRGTTLTTSGSPGTASTAPTTTCATRVSARATWRRSPRAACAQACTPPGTGGRSSSGEGSRSGCTTSCSVSGGWATRPCAWTSRCTTSATCSAACAAGGSCGRHGRRTGRWRGCRAVCWGRRRSGRSWRRTCVSLRRCTRAT